MSTEPTDRPAGPSTSLDTFRAHLAGSSRILALCGAGLSAASGLPTFRGAGGLWRNHDATSLATPEAFGVDPGLVWQFYGHRRHMALQAEPNRAHKALAELAKRRKGFVMLTQNVDGLSPRAGHPREQLHLLHGSLFDITCSGTSCDYVEKDNFADPLVPALAVPTAAEAASASASGAPPPSLNIADASIPLRAIPTSELPRCPKCAKTLLRPGVVWFGEALPQDTLDAVSDFLDAGPKIDLIVVIGTSAVVYPAAGYVDIARGMGARVAVVNMDRSDVPGGAGGLEDSDWFFQGDAGELVPAMLRDVIGEIR